MYKNRGGKSRSKEAGKNNICHGHNCNRKQWSCVDATTIETYAVCGWSAERPSSRGGLRVLRTVASACAHTVFY